MTLNARSIRTGCKALVSIRTSKNELTEVDLNDCPLLQKACFTSNSLTKVNIDGCMSLRELHVGYNSLTDIFQIKSSSPVKFMSNLVAYSGSL